MLAFMIKVYRNQKKDYHTLLLILIILSAFEFSFLAMYDAFTEFNFEWNVRSSINGIPTLASSVALILNFFVVKYFIANKKQEFSILLLSGRKPRELLYYLLMQFGLLSLIAFFLGGLLGTLLMTGINASLGFQHLNITLHYTPFNVWFYSFWFLLFTIVVILAISANQFVRLDTDLAKFLTHKVFLDKPIYKVKASAVTTPKKLPISSIILTIFILYMTIYSLFQLSRPQLSMNDLLMSFTFALAGIYAIILTTIPLIYDLFHHKLLNHPILMNALSSFNEFSKVMVTLVSLNMVILPIMLFLIFFSSYNKVVQAIILPCFIMIVFMIGLCFILRFFIYDKKRTLSIATLHAIGYSQKSLNKISFIKNILFAIFTFIIPFLFISELLYKARLEGLLSTDVIMIMLISYLIIDCFIIIYISIKEKTTQKEVTSHVKYLNRGQ